MSLSKELGRLIAAATDARVRADEVGPEHTDIRISPRGHLAMLAWGTRTLPDAQLLVWLWNHRRELANILAAAEDLAVFTAADVKPQHTTLEQLLERLSKNVRVDR